MKGFEDIRVFVIGYIMNWKFFIGMIWCLMIYIVNVIVDNYLVIFFGVVLFYFFEIILFCLFYFKEVKKNIFVI